MPDKADSKIIDLESSRVACKDCNLFQLCLPVGIDGDDLERLDNIIKRRRPLKRGDLLFHESADFQSIYAVRSGSLKTYSAASDGQEQVTGFHLPGELLGLEAISGRAHPCAAKALETTSVCEIPYERFEELCSELPSLQQLLLQVMSKELLHEHTLLQMHGKKGADERLASLLLSISNRYKARGFSPTDFHLSMSRNDIGNYLGLAVETVSRLFTRFQREKLLTVQRKHICILDPQRLADLAGGVTRAESQLQA